MLFSNTRCTQLCHSSLQSCVVEITQHAATRKRTTDFTCRSSLSSLGQSSSYSYSYSYSPPHPLHSSSSSSPSSRASSSCSTGRAQQYAGRRRDISVLSGLSSSSSSMSMAHNMGRSSSVLQRGVRHLRRCTSTNKTMSLYTWDHQGKSKPLSLRRNNHSSGLGGHARRRGSSHHRAIDTSSSEGAHHQQHQQQLSTLPIDKIQSTNIVGHLKVMTFNLLAPCYFRSEGVYESTSMRKILQRHRCIIGVLREQKCDVCCLQEFWFNDNLRNLYQEELRHLYFINTLQRTRSEDGVAILLLKEKFHVVNQHNILFREHSKFGHDRVALCVLAQLANQNQTTNNSPPDSPPSFSGQSQGQGEGQVKSSKCFSPPMAFVTSHLTYPHHTLDEYSRLEQSKVLLRKSKEFVEKSCPPNTPIIISGDFNGTLEDQVCEEMRASGYMDTFSQATGIQQNRITHCDHRKNQKGVDYIWLSHTYAGDGTGADNEAERSLGNSRNPEEQSKQNMLPYENNHLMELNTIEAYLLPRDIPCDTKMHRPRFRSPLSNTLDLDLMGEGGGENNNNNNSNNQQGVEGRKKRFMQDEMVSPGKLTLNSLDSFEDYDEHSFASELDWMSWCNLSDHRPMVVHFDIYASSLEEDK